MSDKITGIYFGVLSILYFIYTVFVAQHGIHFTNFIITVVFLAISVIYFFKT